MMEPAHEGRFVFQSAVSGALSESSIRYTIFPSIYRPAPIVYVVRSRCQFEGKACGFESEQMNLTKIWMSLSRTWRH